MAVGVDAQSLPERLAGLLAARGASVMFGLPGGGPNLDVIGAAVRRGLRFVLAHDETAASIMAATHGLLTGSPTAVVVTRGPGVASAANGIAQAQLDRYPLVAITDTVPAHQRARVSHQRLDQQALLGPVTKTPRPTTPSPITSTSRSAGRGAPSTSNTMRVRVQARSRPLPPTRSSRAESTAICSPPPVRFSLRRAGPWYSWAWRRPPSGLR